MCSYVKQLHYYSGSGANVEIKGRKKWSKLFCRTDCSALSSNLYLFFKPSWIKLSVVYRFVFTPGVWEVKARDLGEWQNKAPTRL